MIKVKFTLTDGLLVDYRSTEPENLEEIRKSISRKIEGKVFEMPFMPTIGLKIWLAGFDKIFGFTNEEEEELMNEDYQYVSDLTFHGEFLELDLSYEKP